MKKKYFTYLIIFSFVSCFNEPNKEVDNVNRKHENKTTNYIKDETKKTNEFKIENFSGLTPSGESVSLYNLKKKITLIHFWASWCIPCRHENSNIVNIHEDYKDKNFSIVSVSLDNDKSEWKRAIRKDNMQWNNISNLMKWKEPIAELFEVRSLPTCILLDENGNIIGKDLRGDELRKKIEQHMP